MVEKTEKVIEIVKTYPVLYDPSHEDYKNSKVKNSIWQIIADMLNEKDGEVIKNRWNNLRDSYSKYLRTVNIREGFGLKHIELYKTWPWAIQMSFLQPYLEYPIPNVLQRGSENYISDQQSDIILEQDDRAVQQVQCQETEAGFEHIPNIQQIYQQITSQQSYENRATSNQDTSSSSQPQHHSSRRARESQLDKVLEYLKSKDNKEFDETDLIFLGYSKLIKKMSLQQQASVKFSIAKIIMEAELNHAEKIQNPQSNQIVNIKEEISSVDMNNASQEVYEDASPPPECLVELSDFSLSIEVKEESLTGTDPLTIQSFDSQSLGLPALIADSVPCIIYSQPLNRNPKEYTELPIKKIKLDNRNSGKKS